jgi:hypothetical protein
LNQAGEIKPLRKVAMAEVQSAIGTNLQKIEKLYIPQKSKNTEFRKDRRGRSEETGRQA